MFLLLSFYLITSCASSTDKIAEYNTFIQESEATATKSNSSMISQDLSSPKWSTSCNCPSFYALQNPSFELGALNWFGYGPLHVVPAGVYFYGFTNQPTDGVYSILLYFDGRGPISWWLQTANPVSVPGCGKKGDVSLKFDYRVGYDLLTYGATEDRIFKVQILDPCNPTILLQEDIIYIMKHGTYNSDTGNLVGSVDLNAWKYQNIIIKFVWVVPEYFSGPASAMLDNLRIVNSVNDELCTDARDCKCRNNCKGKKCSARIGGGHKCSTKGAVCCCEEYGKQQCEADEVEQQYVLLSELELSEEEEKEEEEIGQFDTGSTSNSERASINDEISNSNTYSTEKVSTSNTLIITIIGVILFLCGAGLTGFACFVYQRKRDSSRKQESEVIKEMDVESVCTQNNTEIEKETEIVTNP